MNRGEALQKLQNFYNWYNDDEFDFDKEKEIKYDNDLKNIIEYLRQPTKLAEFLGWKENEIYTCFANQYSIKNDELCFLNYKNEWRQACSYQELMDIKQQAKKIESKKYYLKLKGEYGKFIDKKSGFTFLNYRKNVKTYFLGSAGDDVTGYKTQFTYEEIKNIKLPEPLTIDMFDKIEVE